MCYHSQVGPTLLLFMVWADWLPEPETLKERLNYKQLRLHEQWLSLDQP